MRGKTAFSAIASVAPLLLSALSAAHAMPGSQCGVSAWYEHTTPTASGEPADPTALAAAHRSLPFGRGFRE